MAAIRDAHPDAEITWVINPEWATILRGNPRRRSRPHFPARRNSRLGAPRSLWPWLKKTRTLQPDVAIDFQGLFRSAFIGKVSGAERLWGLSDGREGSRFFYRADGESGSARPRGRTLSETGGSIRRADSAKASFSVADAAILCRVSIRIRRSFCFTRSRAGSQIVCAIPWSKEFCRAFDPIRVVIVGKSSRKIAVPENCVEPH